MNLIQSLYNRLIAYFKKEKWAYVKMFTIDDVKSGGKKGKVYIHCYESNSGERKVDTSCTFTDIDRKTIDDFVRAHEIYQERLVRWLAGRHDPEIPRFSEIGEEDTVNALKGTIK